MFNMGLKDIWVEGHIKFCKKKITSKLYKQNKSLAHNMYQLHSYILFTLYLLVSSADNFCKQFGPRSVPTKCRAWSGSNLFDGAAMV